MTGSAALPSGVTPMAAEAVAAAIVIALGVALLVVVGYAVVVGSVAWVLVLLVGLLRVAWASLCLAAVRVRRRLRRTPAIPAVGLTPGPPTAGLLP